MGHYHPLSATISTASNLTVATTAAPPALVPATLAERLLARAVASAPDLRAQCPASAFAEALERSATSRFKDEPRPPSPAEVERYLESLHHADLALACACAAGNDAAWEHFVRTYRPDMYAAARAVAKQANPHELADGIYAELFGLEEREGKRRSLFHYFHGRSKLSTWLRAIVAQRFVDQLRAQRRTTSLTEDSDAEGSSGAPLFPPQSGGKGGPGAAHTLDAPDPDRDQLLVTLQRAVESAIASLDPRDRLRLSYYYTQDLTLAQIGRLLGESEATASRKLDRTRADLRKRIEESLRNAHRLSDAQIQLCFDYAREQWPFDLSAALTKGP